MVAWYVGTLVGSPPRLRNRPDGPGPTNPQRSPPASCPVPSPSPTRSQHLQIWSRKTVLPSLETAYSIAPIVVRRWLGRRNISRLPWYLLPTLSFTRSSLYPPLQRRTSETSAEASNWWKKLGAKERGRGVGSFLSLSGWQWPGRAHLPLINCRRMATSTIKRSEGEVNFIVCGCCSGPCHGEDEGG
jgi:hypothetical protein